MYCRWMPERVCSIFSRCLCDLDWIGHALESIYLAFIGNAFVELEPLRAANVAVSLADHLLVKRLV